MYKYLLYTFLAFILPFNSVDDVTAEELNDMKQEEFQVIIDSPPKPPEQYITVPMSAYMRLAYDNKLNDTRRGVMIDRLIIKGAEPDLVPKLLKLYYETDHSEIKTKIISGLTSYNQVNLRKKPNIRDKELLKNFFSELISETLNQHSSGDAALGFIQTHSADEIMLNLDKIDAQLKRATHNDSIIIKYSLVYMSKKLQTIYIKSIVQELREANSADLDDYFFGPLSIGYNGTGKDLLLPESQDLVIDYLKEVRYKYTAQGIQDNIKDPSRGITSIDYFNLLKAMDIESLFLNK